MSRIMSPDKYEIREAGVNEKPVLMDFLERHFFPREYLLSSYLTKNKDKIDEKENRNIKEDLRSMHEAMLERLPCLVAVEKETKEIVGMNLVRLERNQRLQKPTDLNQLDLAKVTDAESLDKVIDELPKKSQLLTDWFVYVLDAADQTDLFEIFPRVKLALKLMIVCVDPNHAGKGLSTRLIREAVDWAKQKHDVGMVSGLFTSPFSIKAAEKNGFKSHKKLDILTLKDAQGHFIYEGLQSFVISVMVKTL